MKTQLYIPSKCKVGFNTRTDTYTGKLGYVIYFDGKVWRKEASWEGWRERVIDEEFYETEKSKQFNTRETQFRTSKKTDGTPYYTEEQIQQYLGTYENFRPNLGRVSKDPTIEPFEFENKPIEGFVLNKKAGGYSTGWNHRSTYCRIYDPRGFEFEISIPNLLFILQETNSYKGKGLEGEFVYAWEGKDLVLLPAHCEEYTKSQNFTKLQAGKVSSKNLIPGCSYKTKKENDLIYIGKFNFYSLSYLPGKKYKSAATKLDKSYVFVDPKSTSQTSKFLITNSLSNLTAQNSDIVVENYASLVEEFSKEKYSSKPLSIREEVKVLNLESKNNHSYYLEGEFYKKDENNKWTSYSILVNFENIYRGFEKSSFLKNFRITPKETIEFKEEQIITTSLDYRYNSDHSIMVNQEQLNAMSFVELFVNLENGKNFTLKNYRYNY